MDIGMEFQRLDLDTDLTLSANLNEMSSLFRSELMSRCQLLLQSESAYHCVSELGELGLVEFVDLNPELSSFQRKFVSEVKRCEEMERICRFIERECIKEGIIIDQPLIEPPAPQVREMVELENNLLKFEEEFEAVNVNYIKLKNNQLELMELKSLLDKAEVLLANPILDLGEENGESQRLLSDTDEGNLISPQNRAVEFSMQFNVAAGIVNRERLPSFERMIWRICKGNVFVKTSDVDIDLKDPLSGEPLFKSVFMIFFQGEQLKARIKKVCDGFHASQYPCPTDTFQRREMFVEVKTKLEDLSSVLQKTNDHRLHLLTTGSKDLRNWYVKVRKIKSIYHCLNLFNVDVTKKAMVAECWIPQANVQEILDALKRGSETSESDVPPILNTVPTSSDPPTFNRTNKVTSGFQALIDSYGINSYREINPASFAIITFPFLFGVMFGDVGHGIIMFLAALFLVLKEKKLEHLDNELFVMLYGGRYIILLMGMFSVYVGFIYNDCFSRSFNIFGSAWYYNGTWDGTAESQMLDPANPHENSGSTYALGIDPIWQLSSNKITFLNTYKMKISLIFGLVHMVFGVFVSLWNKINFKHTIDILLEFIPQMMFLLCTFCYLLFLIFFKWIVYSASKGVRSEHCAPSLLITFINMMLLKEETSDPKLNALCHGKEIYMFNGQRELQKVLLFTGLLMVPIMFFGKPIHILIGRWSRRSNYSSIDSENESSEESFGNILIFQAIHTIEYVLGSVSHTASYLRLWALSLAHSQLSEVLWNMVMKNGFGRSYSASVMMFFIFGSWASLTVGILVLMEGLSAFLHTLRLHWVEFMSKFYSGQGSLFIPFSFKAFLKESRLTDKEILKS